VGEHRARGGIAALADPMPGNIERRATASASSKSRNWKPGNAIRQMTIQPRHRSPANSHCCHSAGGGTAQSAPL